MLIAKKKYDPKRARKFKRQYTAWLPYLTTWDAILRLMAAEGGIEYRFKPGFVLEDGVVGMCAQGKNGGIIYVHPDRFKEYATAHAERPMALASFLHQLAAHELAHLQRGGGDGHSEEFSSTREALGRATAHLVPAFAVLCASVLRLPVKESPEQSQIRELKEQLARGGAGKGRSIACGSKSPSSRRSGLPLLQMRLARPAAPSRGAAPTACGVSRRLCRCSVVTGPPTCRGLAWSGC
ncbi:hypothetical protein [Nannocystis pusilla]|uniref:hypothetical protein n=1 Tax=Nannocystis pusilla TaxID=889268 RepID=UPI003B76417D